MAAGAFALMACVKGLLMIHVAARANMSIHDLPEFWTLANSTPPHRALAPQEVVLFRKCVSVLVSAVWALFFVAMHFASLKRRRAELAIAAHFAELERRSSEFNTLR